MNLDKYTIEYYDSFADEPSNEVLDDLKRFLEKNNPTKQYLKLKVNHVVEQRANSANCGYFAMDFIIDRFRGKPWREATKYHEAQKGEKEIDKFKKQIGGSYM